MEVMAALRREPGSLVDLPEWAGEDIQMMEFHGRKRREAELIEREAKASIIESLGEAEGGRLPDGGLVTYLSQRSPARLDAKRLRADHPEIYEDYVTQGTHRVLRIKKPKELTHE